MQIIGAFEVNDKPNTYVQARQSVIRDQRFFPADENLGDNKRWLLCMFLSVKAG